MLFTVSNKSGVSLIALLSTSYLGMLLEQINDRRPVTLTLSHTHGIHNYLVPVKATQTKFTCLLSANFTILKRAGGDSLFIISLLFFSIAM